MKYIKKTIYQIEVGRVEVPVRIVLKLYHSRTVTEIFSVSEWHELETGGSVVQGH